MLTNRLWTYVIGVLALATAAVAVSWLARGNTTDRQQAVEPEVVRIDALQAELDRRPERRRALIDSVLGTERGPVGTEGFTVERWVVQGDPAIAPILVVLWAVVTPPAGKEWISFAYDAERLHHRLNEALRVNGFPTRLSMGVASAEDVRKAGGDDAYFGKDERKREPQYPPSYVIYPTPRLEMPPRATG